MNATGIAAAPDFTAFTVFLDDPSDQPRLGFGVYADCFAQIIEHSQPRFAIGIFGDWGSGKTTLMRAIEERVAAAPDSMLPVWFNAWRYEREEHLIVPLLDNLRDALLAWSATRADDATRQRAARAASLFGRAARRFLRGLTIKAGFPGVGEASLAFDRIVDAPAANDGPSSFYHAAFGDLREATAEFRGGDDNRRVVVFVDDLDRCLPANALEVLESMKLFFDLMGFVFVVGLDRGVIERSIEAKYEAGSPPAPTRLVVQQSPAAPHNGDGAAVVSDLSGTRAVTADDRTPPVNGGDYIKKIFQVPFALPQIGTDQLDELVDALRSSPRLPGAQADDLEHVVKGHLLYLTDRDSVNPREVKRLINAYTLQMKLLQPRLGAATSPDTVLAIQLMGFRADWERLYDVLLADPEMFVEEMRHAVEETGPDPVVLGDDAEPVPPAFLAYFRGKAAPLLAQPSLTPYISSAEQTRNVDPGSLQARKAVRSLQRLFRAIATDRQLADPSSTLTEVSALRDSLSRSSSSAPLVQTEILPQVAVLERLVKQISGPDVDQETIATLGLRGTRTVERIAEALQEMRRQANLAGTR